MNIEIHGIGDSYGPAKILILQEPRVGLKAIVVVDNVACGPSIGGIRMAPDVTVMEVFRLARAMTFKNAAAGLPHGGGKSGIIGDPLMPMEKKEELIRTFACMIRELKEYIPGPDMGTNEECMAWVKDEIGRVVGLPRVVGGIPLDEIGATGYGVAIAAEVAAPEVQLSLEGARVVVQGFGSVGFHAARFLAERGAKLIATCDIRGATFNPDGLDLNGLLAHKESGASVGSFSGGTSVSIESLIGIESDIWIPAARPDVFTIQNVKALKTKLVLQGANIPATEEAEIWMHSAGILNVPDFIANAGGVICASVEYHGGTQKQAMAAIEEKIRINTEETLFRAKKGGLLPRVAATEMATSRLKQAMRYYRP